MAAISTYLLIIILNVNDFNTKIKIHKLAYWNKKQILTLYYLQETLPTLAKLYTHGSEKIEKVF